jgi:hypothetical protein
VEDTHDSLESSCVALSDGTVSFLIQPFSGRKKNQFSEFKKKLFF